MCIDILLRMWKSFRMWYLLNVYSIYFFSLMSVKSFMNWLLLFLCIKTWKKKKTRVCKICHMILCTSLNTQFIFYADFVRNRNVKQCFTVYLILIAVGQDLSSAASFNLPSIMKRRYSCKDYRKEILWFEKKYFLEKIRMSAYHNFPVTWRKILHVRGIVYNVYPCR